MDAYRIAEGFFLYNVSFSFIFFLVAGAISFLAFRVNRLTRQASLRWFSFGFLAFSLSHGLMVLTELVRLSLLSPIPPFGRPPGAWMWPLLMGLTFTSYLVGLVLLFWTTCKQRDARLPFLLGALLAVAMLLVERPVFLFQVFATILLFFLALHYMRRWWAHKNAGSLLVFLAFFFLLGASLLIVFSFHEMVLYGLGRVLQLAGYGCFLANLVLVLKR